MSIGKTLAKHVSKILKVLADQQSEQSKKFQNGSNASYKGLLAETIETTQPEAGKISKILFASAEINTNFANDTACSYVKIFERAGRGAVEKSGTPYKLAAYSAEKNEKVTWWFHGREYSRPWQTQLSEFKRCREVCQTINREMRAAVGLSLFPELFHSREKLNKITSVQVLQNSDSVTVNVRDRDDYIHSVSGIIDEEHSSIKCGSGSLATQGNTYNCTTRDIVLTDCRKCIVISSY